MVVVRLLAKDCVCALLTGLTPLIVNFLLATILSLLISDPGRLKTFSSEENLTSNTASTVQIYQKMVRLGYRKYC